MGNMSYDGNILLNIKRWLFSLFYKTKKAWKSVDRICFFPWWWFVAKPWYVCLCCMGAWALLKFLLFSG